MATGEYEILQRIATGGMAEIFLAKQLSVAGFERRVVIKRVLPELAADPGFVESFLAEGRLCAQLSHANIVQVIELGQMDQSYFIALEYIDGIDGVTLLGFARGAGQPLPMAVALRIGCDLLTGLDFAHELTDDAGQPLGLIHRDVSPSNILVAFNGVTKVVDFGIAKASAKAEGKTRTGVVKGKLGYLAPEQIARRGVVDKRIDVFAAGIVLFELLSNRHPFRGDSEIETLQNIAHEAPPKLAALGLDVDPQWQALIDRALDKNPDTRFASCAEFATAIETTAAKTGLRLSSLDVREYLGRHRPRFDELLATRRQSESGRRSITAPLTVPEASADPEANAEPATREIKRPGAQSMPPPSTVAAAAAPNSEQPSSSAAKQALPLAALALGCAVVIALLLGMWAVGRGFKEPPRAVDTKPFDLAAAARPRTELSAQAKRNKLHASGTAPLDPNLFPADPITAASARGDEPIASTPGLCLRDEGMTKRAHLHRHIVYRFKWKIGSAPVTAWLETQPEGAGEVRKWPAQKLAKPGELELSLPARELAPGRYSLTQVIAHGPKEQTRATLDIVVGDDTAARAHPTSGAANTDDDGDCQTIGEGDCDDRNEAVFGDACKGRGAE